MIHPRPLPEIAAQADDMVAWRHELHRFPELGHDVPETARRIARWLRECGVTHVAEGVGGHGVVGVIEAGAGPSIGLRADLDALPVTEAVARPHASTRPGHMHACGHDGHCAMLLGAARYLAATRRFRGRVVLVFQPAEEINDGATRMLADGLLDRFDVDAIFGIHNLPGLGDGPGWIGVPAGPVMAAVSDLEITVRGAGGHAALPHLVRDPIVAAAAVVTALQTVVSRVAAPAQALVVSITDLHAGSGAHNVIPDQARLLGTVRYLDPAMGEGIPRRLVTLVEGVARAHGVTAEVRYAPRCPVTVNSAPEALAARAAAADVVGPSRAGDTSPLLAGEDFGCYLQQRPGAYALISNGDSSPLHAPTYDFNDAILPIGASYLARLVERASA